MPPRPHPYRALSFAAALAAASFAAPFGEEARAQSAGLRGGFDSGAFPNSPAAAPILSPERTSPTLNASPSAADESSPAVPSQSSTDEDRGAPNYGKPRKAKPKLYGPKLRSNPPLPPLVPYRGAPGPERRALNPAPPRDAIETVEPAPNVAVIPSPLRSKKPLVELDPYAPTGVRIGELRLLPFVEASTGYETNPNQVSTGVKPSAVLRGEAGLDVLSDFSNHSFSANLRGGYSLFPSNSNADRPDASGIVRSRIDVTRDDKIDLEGRFVIATQTPGSPLLAVPNSVFIVNRPLITSEGATLGGTHTFNRLTVGLRGTFDRTQYGDATQSDGSIFRYSQDNYNDYGLVARAAYEVSPAIIPFIEVGADARIRDNPIDLSGFRRNSTGVVARAGADVEVTRLLTGTVSAGYADRHYADPRLPNLRGPTVDGALAYAVTPLTTITFSANTTLSETTLAGASGAISRQLSLQVDHRLFRNFTITGIATYQPNQYQGVPVTETYTQFTLKGLYAVTRDIQLIASASRQQLKSSLGQSSFTDNVFLAGVRLQR